MSFIPTDLSMLENAMKSLYVLYTRQRLPHDWNETTKHLQMASISKQRFLNFEITHKKTKKTKNCANAAFNVRFPIHRFVNVTNVANRFRKELIDSGGNIYIHYWLTLTAPVNVLFENGYLPCKRYFVMLSHNIGSVFYR